MHSMLHPYLNWAKERLDEMDAALASFEAKLRDVQADARVKASQMLADLRKKRDHFQESIGTQAQAGEAAWAGAKAKLESEWDAYEAQAKEYVEAFARQFEQQRAIFRLQADAQLKSWRAAADRFRNDATEFAAVHRNEVKATVERMNTDAAAAEDKLRMFGQAGIQSWSAMMAALAETRAAFDRASQASAEAFNRAAR